MDRSRTCWAWHPIGSSRTGRPRQPASPSTGIVSVRPRHRPKPVTHLLADVIDEYLKHNRSKRSWKDDDRHGKRWKERFGGRTLEDITPGELERMRTERVSRSSLPP